MAVHIAYMTEVHVNKLGKVVNKATATIKDMMTSSSELRVAPDSNVASTGDPQADPPTTYPTIAEYLVREEALGFRATMVNATMIITYDS